MAGASLGARPTRVQETPKSLCGDSLRYHEIVDVRYPHPRWCSSARRRRSAVDAMSARRPGTEAAEPGVVQPALQPAWDHHDVWDVPRSRRDSATTRCCY